MKTKATTLSILLALLLSGCTSAVLNQKAPCGSSSFGKEYSHKKIDFNRIISNSVDKIFSQIKAGELTSGVVVTDFVEVETLSNKNRLGFILSSALKNELAANRKLKIVEAETAKYFKIGENGTTLLSRDKNDSMLEEIGAKYALVGTYATTDERVVIYIKLINLANGKIEAAATEEDSMSCEIREIITSKSDKIL